MSIQKLEEGYGDYADVTVGQKCGTAIISAKANYKTYGCTVKVLPDQLSIDPTSITVKVNKTPIYFKGIQPGESTWDVWNELTFEKTPIKVKVIE